MSMNAKELLLAKLTSGRFIFTLITGFVFAYLAITGELSTERVQEVILIVIYAYFSRTDRGEKQINKGETK